jgi:uncharacterized Zn-binding protein involved in type VI secretion
MKETAKPAARVDGIIISGSPDVLVGKMPAATVGSSCFYAGGTPDVIIKGSSSVLVNKKPAARMGDSTACGGIVANGSLTVLIGD